VGQVDVRAVLGAFSGRRVFVTGHTGFKGSWLAFLLNEVGAEVMGYALKPCTTPNHFELLQLDRKISSVIGDIRDGPGVLSAIQSFQPEFVFHLAAQALVSSSYADPVLTFETNILGSINILEAVRQAGSVRSLVYITSDKCYENLEWVWGYRENDRLGGHDPYSASKAAAEIAFSAYAKSFFSSRPDLGAASARAGNVIGGGDWADNRIVPDCVRAALADAAIQLRRPEATRPWQHVLEPLSGYLLLAHRLRNAPSVYGGAWNFGPNSREIRTVREVADKIIGRLGRGRVEILDGPPGVHEAGLLQLNCEKANQMLGWYPRWDVDKALTVTADWYKAVVQGRDATAVTRAQIHDYFPEVS